MSAGAQTHVLDVNTKKLGAPVQPTMYGIFFEDINYAADGGLYAELVMNRSFEYPNHFAGWDVSGNVTIKDDGPFERNPHYVRMAPTGHGDKHSMIENRGFFGMGVKGGQEYRFSVWARVPDGGKAKLWIDLVDNATMGEDQKLCNAGVEVSGSEWKKYTATLKPKTTFAKAHLRVWADSKVTTDVEHVSLFSTDTWKGRENGMRKDLAQALFDMHPGVFRFPGGCIVEGTDLATRYQWKNTVGPVENRPLNENRWNYTFPHRLYPNYYQSYGLGFYEFFLLSEKIGAEPLPVVSVGLACQFQNDDICAHVSPDELQPYIDDALDLIEFANGSTDTKWGKLRAEMGHPAPFNLKLIGVGNEQWGELYPVRLEKFIKAIRAKYPEIKIVGSSGPSPDDNDGKEFTYGWEQMRRLKADLVDEHFYRSPEWFLSQAGRYDNYSRKGPKVFAGEFACHISGSEDPAPAAEPMSKNTFNAALCEAAFMTGLERNADVVHMATYAPLFSHVDGWQWRPDLIWMDNLTTVRTPNYYVQQLYATNAGTNVLETTENKKPLEGNDGMFASAVYDKPSGDYILKVANTNATERTIEVTFKGVKSLGEGTVTSIHDGNPDAFNSLSNKNNVTPKTSKVSADGNILRVTIPAKTFSVYRF